MRILALIILIILIILRLAWAPPTAPVHAGGPHCVLEGWMGGRDPCNATSLKCNRKRLLTACFVGLRLPWN